MWNNFKTTILLAALTGALLAIGQLWGGERGLVVALVVAAAMNLGSYFFSDKIALAMSGAQPVTREQAPRLYQVVDRLGGKANLPTPKVYLIPTDSPNAFATGRNPAHAAVAHPVTRKLSSGADQVTLGRTGIKSSLIGMGTGSVGVRRSAWRRRWKASSSRSS